MAAPHPTPYAQPNSHTDLLPAKHRTRPMPHIYMEKITVPCKFTYLSYGKKLQTDVAPSRYDAVRTEDEHFISITLCNMDYVMIIC